jgi:hypothetical protein
VTDANDLVERSRRYAVHFTCANHRQYIPNHDVEDVCHRSRCELVAIVRGIAFPDPRGINGKDMVSTLSSESGHAVEIV